MPKVLLVDDEPNIRWTMAEFLKREGYETLISSDFDGAMSVIESNSLDAAVIDIILPRRSGLELLNELSAREPYVPVIMITGEPNVSHIPELVRSGAYDFLPKPVHKEALIRAVANAVEKKRLVEEKLRLEAEIKRHAEQLETLVAERTRELAEAHDFLNTVLNSSTEYAIIAIDKEGRFTLFNRGAELMFGYRAEQVLNKQARASVVAEDNLASQDMPFVECGQMAEAMGRHQVEIEMRRADATTFIASLTMTPIRRREGQSVGYLGIIKDLTLERQHAEEMRQMQARLAHNEKITALGRMAAQVAHEVKNPLAGLRLYSLHLKTKLTDKIPDAEMRLIDKIIDVINHLSDTAEQILNFARPITIAPRRVNLNRLINDVAGLLEPQLAANKIEVDLRQAAPDASALVDEASMRATLINLMLNSIQAMPSGGRLGVKVERDQATYRIEVTDTGTGMTADQIKNVFEPFYTTKSQGLGLGMSYAKKVIELHGGSVQVDSRAGEGTQIKITLPAEG